MNVNSNADVSNKVCGRIYVELTGYLASPLSVGSGEQEETDADVILDIGGKPFIPGSALAGALQAYDRQLGIQEEAGRLFGMPKNGDHGSDSDRQSRVFCYDVRLNNAEVGIRDGVKLDEHKTPDAKSKYEVQIIERNADFRMRIEIVEREEQLKGKRDIHEVWDADMSCIQRWTRGFSTGELRIGAKSNRGLGKLKVEDVKVKKFNMERREAYLSWLEWDWDNENAFEQAEAKDIEDWKKESEGQYTEHFLEVPLRIPYTMLIRTYNTAFGKENRVPDYEMLTVGGKGEQAVIPGSSIAGAFRSHIAKIVQKIAHLYSWSEAQKKLEPFFGTWILDSETVANLCASRIIFEEMVVEGGHGLPLTRNAIDRFTGGTVEGALYEAAPWAGGTGKLHIRWKRGDEREQTDKVICGMLLWAILDLQSGILPIGGETAVGRGIFCELDEEAAGIILDGNPLSEMKKKEYMQMAAQWCKKGCKMDGRI